MFTATLILGMAQFPADRLPLIKTLPSAEYAANGVTTVPGEPSTLVLALIAVAMVSGYISVMRRVRPQRTVQQLLFTRSGRTESPRRKVA
jgi:hypothetical protein